MSKSSSNMVIVLIGPMGCGKTTIGKTLAISLGWTFYDADDYHPDANKEKMAAGNPLNDEDRQPWLLILRELIQQNLSSDKSMILACSALKQKYRTTLGIDQEKVVSVLLKGSYSLLERRIAARSHEFMAKNLLQSQLDTLEEPEDGFVIDIDDSPEKICQKIIQQILG